MKPAAIFLILNCLTPCIASEEATYFRLSRHSFESIFSFSKFQNAPFEFCQAERALVSLKSNEKSPRALAFAFSHGAKCSSAFDNIERIFWISNCLDVEKPLKAVHKLSKTQIGQKIFKNTPIYDVSCVTSDQSVRIDMPSISYYVYSSVDGDIERVFYSRHSAADGRHGFSKLSKSAAEALIDISKSSDLNSIADDGFRSELKF